jgi:hypothetical protein
MFIVTLLTTQKEFEKLVCSKKLIIYVQSFYKNSDNETSMAVIINEKQESFLVINEPFDHEYWRELDRLSISCDKDYSEELLQYYTQEKKDWRHKDDNFIKLTEIHNPSLSVYREEYEVVSGYEDFKEQIQADFALLLTNSDKSILFSCSFGANVQVICDLAKINEVLTEAKKVKKEDLFN